MFKLISFICTAVLAYFLFYSLVELDRAYNDKLGTEAIIYHSVFVLLYAIGIVGNYVAVFSGTEIYVTTQTEE